jgi:lipoprotein-releasing system permease protein
MKNLSSMIAWRYLRFKGKDKNISFMIKLCFLGIFIGTFSLMLTLIITSGFEKAIHKKMQGINAQIIINAPGGDRLDYVQIRQAILKEFGPKIHGISGSSLKQAILERNNLQSVVFIKGVDEDQESQVTNIQEKIINSINPGQQKNHDFLKNLLKENQIIIGHKMAKEHNLKINDHVKMMIPEASGKKRISLKKQNVIIAAIFDIGLEEFDNNFAFSSLDFLNETFDLEGVEQIVISLKNDTKFKLSKFVTDLRSKKLFNVPNLVFQFLSYKIKSFFYDANESECIEELKQRFSHLTICSWKDLYPALVSSLKLEKYVMFFILTLISLVASMNMISLLFMQVQHKRRDIAIFAAMGMSNQIVRSIFLKLGLVITISASLTGLVSAALAGLLLQKYPFINLPDVYFISYLPVHMELEIFCIVFFVTILIGFFATWLPARKTKQIKVVSVLREE